MHLSPKEIDKLLLHQACFLAQKRYARGLKLNVVETMALLSGQILELIRDDHSVATLMDLGKQMLGLGDVLDGVADIIHEVQVEGTFLDGTKLVTVHHPICRESGDPLLALHGSGLTRKDSVPSAQHGSVSVTPGQIFVSEGSIEINAQRKTITLKVLNTGDRPIQVGSHYAFMETNRALSFNRKASYGHRLDIAAGTAVRFEPGETKTVQLVEFAGHRIFKGGNAQIDGQIEAEALDALVTSMIKEGFQNSEVQA
jgi:urease subunit gamma/beta